MKHRGYLKRCSLLRISGRRARSRAGTVSSSRAPGFMTENSSSRAANGDGVLPSTYKACVCAHRTHAGRTAHRMLR